MTTYWEKIHEETRDGFDIVLSFAAEDMTPDWDMTEEEKKELFEKIDNGSLLWFVARVEAKKSGICLGEDYLGGCCYASVLDFMEECGYYPDMVNNAIEEAKKTIEELTK